MKENKIMPYIAAVIFSVIFGLSFMFTKKAIGSISAFKLLSFRFLLASVAMSLLVVFKATKVSYKGKPMRDLLITSIAQPVIYFIFETYAIKYTSSSYAGLFIALIPIAVSIMGIYFLKEVPSKAQWVFILLSVAGVAYILLNDRASVSSGANAMGTLFLFIAIISASVYGIYSRKVSVYFSSFEITYFMMIMAAAVFTVASISIDAVNGELNTYFLPFFNRDVIISVIYLGLLSSVVAYYFMNYSLSKLSASKSMVFANLSTIISIAAGVIFLKEKFYFYNVVGSVMILTGIIGTNYFNPAVRQDSDTI